MSDFEDRKAKAIQLANKCQQRYYELLPDWFHYDLENYDLIKQKIGFALFGPPNYNKDTDTLISPGSSVALVSDDNLFNRVVYNEKMCQIINGIYKQIIKHGKTNHSESIFIGIIFNVFFLHATPKKSNESSTDSENEFSNLCVLPLFKLRKHKLKHVQDDSWYIDSDARIYKNWNDYLENNTLPECTMILPRYGLYQSDPTCKVSKNCSTVWIEVLESPACSIKGKILKSIDIGASVTSVAATVGLGIASMVTPVGPVVIAAGMIYSGVTGGWIIGRSSQRLVDLATHKQSISPVNRNAFPAWLGISGSVVALGANGGTMLLSKALSNGTTVGSTVKLAYNSVILSNLTLNSIGIVYQGYCLVEKYQSQRDVDFLDVVLFTSHVLFFSNTVINVKLAGDLIGTSRGTVFKRFQNALRFNRFKEEFNRVFNVEKATNENDGIIYKVKNAINAEDFFSGLNLVPIQYSEGNIVINNNIFIDPVTFARHLLSIGAVAWNLIDPDSSTILTERVNVMENIKNELQRMIREYFCNGDDKNVKLPDVSRFYDMLHEMKYAENARDVLIKIFKISTMILKHCNNPTQFFVDALFFAWLYCKANLRQYGVTPSDSKSKVYDMLTRIVSFLYDCIDPMTCDLYAAFYTYISTKTTESWELL